MGPGAPLPPAGYDGGFFVQSPDGDSRLTLEGLLPFRGQAREPGIGRTSQFDLERMRLERSGELERLHLFHVEARFSESEVELEQAWVGADLGAGGPRLILGRMEERFGLEEMLPRKHLDFVGFSLSNQFSPAEDHGITLLGGGLDGPFEYGLALDNGTGGDDTNSDKDAALRGVVRPFLASAEVGFAGG